MKPAAVKVYPDGREVLLNNAAGKREKARRIQAMHERQASLCCLCGFFLRLSEAIFEHQRPKGMGGAFTDDRIEVDGKPINGVSHWICNSAKGSRRTPYLIQPHVSFDRQFEELIQE